MIFSSLQGVPTLKTEVLFYLIKSPAQRSSELGLLLVVEF